MTIALPLCSRCNAETQLAVENDMYVCRRCGYHAPAVDSMASVLRRSMEALAMTGRPEARTTLQMDQYQANEFIRGYIVTTEDGQPAMGHGAPRWAQRLWETIQQCEDDFPMLYEDEA